MGLPFARSHGRDDRSRQVMRKGVAIVSLSLFTAAAGATAAEAWILTEHSLVCAEGEFPPAGVA